MIAKTLGIVLNYTKYSESSIIVRIYTEEYGLRSYMVNGIRSKKGSQNKIALYQPLTILNLVVYENPKKDINRVSEAKIELPFFSIKSNIKKSTIAIFLTEILSKVLKQEEDANPELFSFIVEALEFFEAQEQEYENFHLIFMLKITAFLGFRPMNVEEMYEQMRLNQVSFSSLTPQNELILKELLQAGFINDIKIMGVQRRDVLYFIIDYYKTQMDQFYHINSLTVLSEILS